MCLPGLRPDATHAPLPASAVGVSFGLANTEVRLMDRVAVITGASRGIGAATALALAEQGFRVVVNYRSSAEQADEVVRAVTAAGGEAVAIRADVTEADDVAAMVERNRASVGAGSTCWCTTR